MKHYNELRTLSHHVDSLQNILQMRWFGVQLLHNKYYDNGLETDKLYAAIYKCNSINDKDAGNRVSSIFIISQYLFAIENHTLVVDLFEKQATKYSSILGYWAALNYNQLKVYYAFALRKINQAEKASVVFKEINPNWFDLNFKKDVFEIYAKLKSYEN